VTLSIKYCIFFVPCIVIILCNVNQQIEHILHLLHLLDCLHKCMKNIPQQNCMYKWPSWWWWTHDVRNMWKKPRV